MIKSVKVWTVYRVNAPFKIDSDLWYTYYAALLVWNTRVWIYYLLSVSIWRTREKEEMKQMYYFIHFYIWYLYRWEYMV